MRYDSMGIILTGEEKISPLTDIRSSNALPIAGRYRIIDFVLSNMANSGITNVGIATEANYSSLMDHTRSGKPWDLDRKNQGLLLLPPNLEKQNYGVIKGNIDILEGIRDYIRESHQTYVVLCLSNLIFNMDFNEIIDEHIAKQADVTIAYKKLSTQGEDVLKRYTLLDIDEDGRVTDIEVQPYYPKTSNGSMEVYVMEKALLEGIIDECSARGDTDFIKDAIIKQLQGMRVFAHEFTGDIYKVDSLQMYYQANQAFLIEEKRNEFFNPERPIYTKTKDQSPTKYSEDAVCKNSFISDGCVIEGTVINSILSRGVRVEKGAVVQNSVIMQDSVIEEGVELNHVVFDKEVVITKGRKLIGQESYPLAIAKGAHI